MLDSAEDPGLQATALSDLRRYHPVFEKLTFQGTKIIFRSNKLQTLRPGQVLYKEGFTYQLRYRTSIEMTPRFWCCTGS